MSRSVLIVAGTLFALGILVWMLTSPREDPVVTVDVPITPASPSPVAAVPEQLPPEPPLSAVKLPRVTGPPPRITTREELASVLSARGLDADRLIKKYQDWRISHGFLDGDILGALSPGQAPAQIYATMDRETQKSLADAGDLGAMHAYAAGSMPDDPFTAIDYYRRASELGSAAAMVRLAEVLADVNAMSMGNTPQDPHFAERLLALRGGDPERDLRQDAAAWALASIRQYGPILATSTNLKLVESLGNTPDKATVDAICGQSLAVLGALSAATSDTDASALPPVFITEQGLYARLPCRDTPAPVMPPRPLAACTTSPAIGSNNRSLELWICPES